MIYANQGTFFYNVNNRFVDDKNISLSSSVHQNFNMEGTFDLQFDFDFETDSDRSSQLSNDIATTHKPKILGAAHSTIIGKLQSMSAMFPPLFKDLDLVGKAALLFG